MMSDHCSEPLLFHCQSCEVEPALGMSTVLHSERSLQEQPVFVVFSTHLCTWFGTTHTGRDFPGLPYGSYGQFIS